MAWRGSGVRFPSAPRNNRRSQTCVCSRSRAENGRGATAQIFSSRFRCRTLTLGVRGAELSPSEAIRQSADPLSAMRSRTNCSSCSTGNRTLRPIRTGVSARCHISSYSVVRLTQSIAIACGMLTSSGRTSAADMAARSTVLFDETMPNREPGTSPISTRVRCSAGEGSRWPVGR